MTIGQSISRIDAHGKVTGQALYPGDLEREGTLQAKLLFSGQPHARMVRIDTSVAEQIPGVVAILTAADVPLNEHGLVIKDQPVMVGVGNPYPDSDLSRWEGDRVALIIAETSAAAAEAAERIEIEWEQLPRLTDPHVAMRDEVILHRAHGSNILRHYKIRKGDVAQGWQEAEVVVEGEYFVPMQEHAYLQPEAGLAYLDEEGRITVEVAGQWTHEDRYLIAHALQMPEEQVRVIYPAIGGAFGGREDMSVQIVLALAVKKLAEMGIKRPVRIVWSREESIIGHHKRHAAWIKARWGARRSGELVVMEAEQIFDAGAYNCTTNKVLGNAHIMVAGPYKVPHAAIDSYGVYTNNCPGGAFRGFGAPQGCFVAESQMNKLAAALQIDPVDLRRINLLRDGDPTVVQTPLPVGVSLHQVLEACAAGAGWGDPLQARAAAQLPRPFRSLPAAPEALRRGRGFGIAFKNIGFSFGFPERCEAHIELHGGGEIERVIVRHAGAEVGQGAHTVMKQLAADAVGVPLEKVEGLFSDTAVTGDSGSASASRMTWMAGNAIIGAAAKALEKWQAEERPAVGFYRFVPRATTMFDEETGRSDPNITYGYVAETAEVAIDTETGHVTVERVVCAVDVGRALNPHLIEGQIEGAVVQAQGYAISENLQHDDGHILNPRLSTYLIPGIMDIPEEVASVLVEEPDPEGPLGARGMAEMPFIPLAPAITAALFDATGVWFDALPLTPDKVLARLEAAGHNR